MKHLFWLDMEMTGLEVETHRILETAAIITDWSLNPLTRFSTAVRQPEEELRKMDDWCVKTHTGSGLLKRVPEGMSEADLDTALVDLLNGFYPADERVVLCGNSIGQDRKFIDKYLPKFATRLHYRMLDVSSFKIVFENAFNQKFKKQNKHEALGDIEESIAEFSHYLSFFDRAKLGLPL
ncbi:MAG: oligoribonuclease [Betaproteobacteria bacterium]|nr:oligoribonuclease [Betaproteobacteria bacterium]